MSTAGGKGDSAEGDNESRKTCSRSKEAAQGRARADEGGKTGHASPRRRRDPNCNSIEYELIIRTDADCASEL